MCLQVGIILDGGEELESPNTITPRPGTVNKPELGKGAHFFSLTYSGFPNFDQIRTSSSMSIIISISTSDLSA